MTDRGLIALLLADSTLAGLVGNRIMPVLLDQGTPMPALTFQIAGGSSNQSFSGSGPQRLRYQFDAHGTRKAEADAVRRAVRAALEGFRGTLIDGTQIQNCQHIQPIDHYDDEPGTFVCSSEFYFYFNQIA